jgi:hypothetical protein
MGRSSHVESVKVPVIECVKDSKGTNNNSHSIIDRQSCLALFPFGTITGKIGGWRPMRQIAVHVSTPLSPPLSSPSV